MTAIDDRAPSRTDRPDSGVSLPSVREVLALDAMLAGRPDVLVGGGALDARVRWVHVSDSAGVARLLDGGELLLSTGSAWPASSEELHEFVAGLADAGLSCLVLELGTHHHEVPPALVAAARSFGLALVVLHREVKFVTVTEAVHRRIIDDQSAALRMREDVRTRFTGLALRGASADYIVAQVAQTLGAPVVLENLAHDVVVAEVPPALEEELLTRWEVRSRLAHRDASEPDWLIVPVEARGIRWGYLVALPGPQHAAGRTNIVEQGALALSLGRLTEGDSDEWGRIGRRQLLDQLVRGRFTGHSAATARVEAAGLPIEGAQLLGVVVTGVAPTPAAADDAAGRVGGRALAGSSPVDGAGSAMLLSLPARTRFDDAAVEAFCRGLGGDPERVVISIGSSGTGLEAGLASLQEAIDLSRTGGGRTGDGPQVRRVENRPLARLVTALRDDHRVIDHGERMLAPLIEYDLARSGDLLVVLEAMLAHPGNRTAAASASHLSRSVFYQRIALIQDLLGTDLDDGEVQTALHLALLVRRATLG
ncbi:PucR family transcriptional regulator [Microbacterium dauci]|uniref:PucR family transcriptional regulator n=1 Tax=Microbacterium dauci TaxID=3048008 RepID=A0ABT6ZEM0_9MICO|nr:PucR family transcriptional regulator [Microbacterium sp. LX3-4]MDJ1114610.1 PucR family transcriptional regulator [Microbacterium sp. LX3-4]